jgi:hypothetical protein
MDLRLCGQTRPTQSIVNEFKYNTVRIVKLAAHRRKHRYSDQTCILLSAPDGWLFYQSCQAGRTEKRSVLEGHGNLATLRIWLRQIRLCAASFAYGEV